MNNKICASCDTNECVGKNKYCVQCINTKHHSKICLSVMMFRVEYDKTNKCICGFNATTTCILQSCKKCCNAKNCSLHKKQNPKFDYNACTLCGEASNELNYYVLRGWELISYCSKCYNNNKSVINLLIFNNTTATERKN